MIHTQHWQWHQQHPLARAASKLPRIEGPASTSAIFTLGARSGYHLISSTFQVSGPDQQYIPSEWAVAVVEAATADKATTAEAVAADKATTAKAVAAVAAEKAAVEATATVEAVAEGAAATKAVAMKAAVAGREV